MYPKSHLLVASIVHFHIHRYLGEIRQTFTRCKLIALITWSDFVAFRPVHPVLVTPAEHGQFPVAVLAPVTVFSSVEDCGSVDEGGHCDREQLK